MNEMLIEFFRTDYMPHGHCYLWKPSLLWLNVISDGLIALAYFSIPVCLFYFIQKRKDVEFKGVIILFSLFIILCGITHLIGINVVWHGTYGIHGLSKLATAIVSIICAIYLYRLLPHALNLPSLHTLKLALETESASKIKIMKEEFEQNQEKMLRETTEAANVSIAVLDDKGMILKANSKFCRLFGYERDEIEHTSVNTLVDPEIKAQHQNLIERFLNSHVNQFDMAAGREVFGIDKSGTRLPLEIHLNKTYNGNMPLVYACVTDLREKRKTQLELKRREKFISRALNTSFAGIYIYNLTLQENEYINSAYTKITGHTLDDLNQLSAEQFLNLFHPEDLQSVLEHMQQVTTASNQEKVFDIEYRFKHKLGHWIWCLSKDTLFETDSKGNATKFIGSFLDITDQKQKEISIQESLRQTQLIMDSTTDGFWHWVDPKTDTANWSDRMYKMLGYAPQEIPASASSFTTLVHPDDQPIMEKALTHSIEQKSLFDIEYRLKTKQGTYKWFRGKGTPYYDDAGNLIEMAGSISDIHTMKQLEDDLRRSNEELEEYSYITSHDLKEPIRTLKTFTGYLLKDLELGDTKRIEEDKQYIQEACDRMTKMIDDLLEFSRVGHHDYSLQVCDTNDIVHEVCNRLNTLIQETHAEIITQAPLTPIFADKTFVCLAVQNLIQNAIKFRKPDTAPIIQISPHATENSSCIIIKDNGIGIAKDKQKHVFGIFKRMHSMHDPSGTGIGLAVVQKIVSRHGGWIELKSEENEGSVFTLHFPNQQGGILLK